MRSTITGVLYKHRQTNNANMSSSEAAGTDASKLKEEAAAAAAAATAGGEEAKTNGDAVNGDHYATDFDLERLLKSFEECVDSDGKIVLQHYIVGYEELYKFLNLLGTVFGWVSTDVDAKLDVVRDHRKSEAQEHYQDVRAMIKYEVDNQLIKHKAKDSKTGTRNLLRLHRALEYIVAFLEQVPDMEVEDKCCPASQSAYKNTLQKHHPWLVQKAALLAMNLLPTKAGLIEKICGSDEAKIKRAEEVLPCAVKAMKSVYSATEEIYKEYDLLKLP